jgi:hypothetical protein
MLIFCDNNEVFIEVVVQHHEIVKRLSHNRNLNEIILISKEGRKTTFFPNKIINNQASKLTFMSSNSCSQIIAIPELELVQEVLRYPNPSSIVRMDDDKGLFANSHIRKASGIDPNQWVGKKMSSYWIEEELERYKRILLKERTLQRFSYTAYLFSGEPASFTVDASLVQFNGELCRWVRVLDCAS